MLTIDSFYSSYDVDDSFDEDYYSSHYKDVNDYLKPLPDNFKWSKRQRLYHHWVNHGSFYNLSMSVEDRSALGGIFLPTGKFNTLGSLCVIVHCYYFDVWEKEILPNLLKIGLDFDLYLTLPDDDNYDLHKSKIISIFSSAKIFKVGNRGADIWPFIFVLQKINRNYDFLLKLHTKKSLSTNPSFSVYYRNHFYKILCENSSFILNCFNSNKNIGILSSPFTRLLLDAKFDLPNFDRFIKLSQKFYTLDQKLDFIAGTMFYSRFDIFKNHFHNSKLNFKSEDFEVSHGKDGYLAHSYERIFGNFCRSKKLDLYSLEDKNCFGLNKSILFVLPSLTATRYNKFIFILSSILRDIGYNVLILNLGDIDLNLNEYQFNTPILSLCKAKAFHWILAQKFDYLFWGLIPIFSSTSSINSVFKDKKKCLIYKSDEDLFRLVFDLSLNQGKFNDLQSNILDKLKEFTSTEQILSRYFSYLSLN